MNEHRKKLERAVNWNIFEIQAALVIATDAKLEEEEKEDKVMLNDDDLQSLQALMKAAARWFTPLMMKEVVEERANAGHCGWPHCCKHISIPSSDPDAADRVRIDYKTKRLLKVDDSSPLTRKNQLLEHAERLIEQNGNSIEGFLDALTPEKAVREVAERSKMEEYSAQHKDDVDSDNINDTNGNINDAEKMWTDEIKDNCKIDEEKKIYKRLRPRGRRDSGSSSSSSSSSGSSTSIYSTRPGRVDPSEWTGVTNKFERERSDRNLDERARLLAEKQEQELDARARREEEEEERRLLKLRVCEKSNPPEPQTIATMEQGVASMSIENYNPLDGRPAAPPSVQDKEPEKFVLKFDANEFKTVNVVESASNESLYTALSSSSSLSMEAKLKGASSFALLWSALDQFYKHLKSKTSDGRGDDDLLEDIAVANDSVEEGLTGTLNIGPLAQLLERGVKAGELAMDISTFLVSLHGNNHEAYRMAVNHMIAQAKMTSSPSLTSTQWRALGVLIIDRVILSLDVVLRDPNFDVGKWDERVEGQASRLKLNASEMFLLRDYWDGLSNRER